MKCRTRFIAACVLLVLATAAVPPVHALEEPDRLWLVGDRAFADRLYLLARRALERFVDQYPRDARVPDALLLLGKADLALGDAEPALGVLRRALAVDPPPGRPLEAKFWEAEALFRLKRFSEARAAYDTVLRTDAASPFAADALYGYAWSELESKRPEPAITAFRDFLATWPDHPLAPSATFYLSRALLDLKRFGEAIPLLRALPERYPGNKLTVDAQYLLGWARVQSGDHRAGVADLRAFVEANPSHPDAPAARRLITQTVARFGDREELQQAYKTLMAQKPVTAEALSEAAIVAGRLGRTKDQEAAWRKLQAEFPEHPLGRRAAQDLASAAFKRKEWKQAIGLAQAATESDEDAVRAEAWLLVGEAELKLRRYPAAVKAFESVGAVKDIEAGVRYRALAGLGLSREEQREWREALAAYEAVAARSPDSALRDWARERVSAVKARMTRTPARSKSGS